MRPSRPHVAEAVRPHEPLRLRAGGHQAARLQAGDAGGAAAKAAARAGHGQLRPVRGLPVHRKGLRRGVAQLHRRGDHQHHGILPRAAPFRLPDLHGAARLDGRGRPPARPAHPAGVERGLFHRHGAVHPGHGAARLRGTHPRLRLFHPGHGHLVAGAATGGARRVRRGTGAQRARTLPQALSAAQPRPCAPSGAHGAGTALGRALRTSELHGPLRVF